ncbi:MULTISPECIES: hypothetical protein [unclassified Microbacterium]|uniref:hypothetical protein n=1 Tax=unclassified Microbacterium TaxID=2609290 RepID=UPI00386463AB
MTTAGRAAEATADADAPLLAQALDVPPSQLTLLSREPLGEGHVAGFRLADAAHAVAYLDTSLLPVDVETGLALEGVARVWIHPADPHLPALAPAAFGQATEILLGRLGMTSAGAPEIVGYRPGRRAVLRVPATHDVVWVKIVRPSRVRRVVDNHARLTGAGLPVPAVHGWSPDGLIVMAGAPGVAATDARPEPHRLLDGVDDLRRALAASGLAEPARTTLLARRDWYAEHLIVLAPGRRDDIRALVAAVGGEHDAPGAAAIHGDLHLGQLFLDPRTDAVTGLIDVDTAGVGAAADDVAAFVGHAVASAALTAEAHDAEHVWALAAAAWERWYDVAGIRSRTAVHLLGHALGAAHSAASARRDGLLAVAAAIVDTRSDPGKTPLIDSFEAIYARSAH